MRIWKVALAAAGLFACGSQEVPVLPGTPELFMGGPWIQGASSEVHLEWPNFYQCDDEDWFGCTLPPSATMSVVSIHCHGCDLLEDPTGARFVSGTTVRAVATTDGPIALHATLRFDGTGVEQMLTASVSGDHEVALQATCGLVDSQTFAEALRTEGGFIGAADLRDCASTRRSSDTVVIAPGIVTFHDNILFPFCFDDSNPCQGYSWHEQQRPRSTIAMSVAPAAWGASGALPGFYFAALPPLQDTPSITLSTPLVTGELSTVSVSIPPLEAPASAVRP
jgi:hypothetical protein